MINEVYRAVQVILNKNDRGVITPDRFNDLAYAVQVKIFSEIPNDIRLAVNRKNAGRGGSSLGYLRSALDRLNGCVELIRSNRAPYYFSLPEDVVKVSGVYYGEREAECVALDKLRMYEGSRLAKPNVDFPIYSVCGCDLVVLPESIGEVVVYYQREVSRPKWTYVNVGGKTVFNAADVSYRDFELDEYFFSRVVSDMLTYLGLHLKEQDVIQISQQEQELDFRKENMA